MGRMQETRTEFRRHDKDTGSPEYQVAGMTERITYLTAHLKSNPKDFSTRRGLVALVNKRRRLLNYLVREDVNRYSALVSALGIRHKAPGRVESREEKYANFPKQKKPKKIRQQFLILYAILTQWRGLIYLLCTTTGVIDFASFSWDDWDTVKNGMKKTFRW